MEKGQICEIKIEDMSTEGQGIGRYEGFAIFVEGAVLGDEVKVEITKSKKNYAFAQVLEIVNPSSYRVVAPCRYFGECGGCGLQNLSYEGQQIIKKKMVEDKLVRLAGLENPVVNDVISMETPFRYRNKVQLPIDFGGLITRKGGIQENLGECAIGFYKLKSHEVVNCEECLLQTKPAEVIAEAVRKYMIEDKLTAFDPKWEKGLMRHLIVRTSVNTGEVMVIIVMNAKALPNGEKLVTMMDDAVNALPPGENGVVYSLESVATSTHRKKSREIMGGPCVIIAGKPSINETIGDLTFEISPKSFYQVNPIQTEKLFDKVKEYANLTGAETVLDLYCGVGAIGLYLASKAKKVIGLEVVKEAVLDANRNAVINRIVNAEFICCKVEEELPKMIEKGTVADIVILDPPRSGCHPMLLETLVKVNPSKIIYVSCDPATQARDVKKLGDMGYEFVEATPVDMFPMTMHVETVCLLSKLKSDHHIEVNLNMDELDLTSAESKASYDEIKEYVLDNSGLKVTNLYIAQVKEKMGIKERENYNISKKEDAKVPNCPADKEKAIIAALKHFSMID